MTTAMTTTAGDLVSMLQDLRRPRRHVDRWIGAALVALVALALGSLWVLDQRTKTTEFTLDDALTKLHETESVSPAPGTADPASVGAASTTGDAQGPASNPVPLPVRRSSGGAAPAEPGSRMHLPAAGVYTYAT